MTRFVSMRLLYNSCRSQISKYMAHMFAYVPSKLILPKIVIQQATCSVQPRLTDETDAVRLARVAGGLRAEEVECSRRAPTWQGQPLGTSLNYEGWLR